MVTMRRPRLRPTMPRRPSTRGPDIPGLGDIGTPLARDTVGTPVIWRDRLIGAHAGTLRAITTIAIIQATGAVTKRAWQPKRCLVNIVWKSPSLRAGVAGRLLRSRLEFQQRDTMRRDVAREGLGGNAEVFVLPEIANTRRPVEANIAPARRHLSRGWTAVK